MAAASERKQTANAQRGALVLEALDDALVDEADVELAVDDALVDEAVELEAPAVS